MDSPNAKSTRSLTRVLNIRRRRSVDPLLPHPRCRESALIPANALLSISLSLFPHSTMRRHHGWNYVGAQREGTWRKTRSKYVPASPPLDPEDLLARFLRVPAIHADEKSANLERLYVSCVPSPGREMANFLRRERETATSSSSSYCVPRRG